MRCEIWEGAKLKGGYGITKYEGRTQLAHRVAYKRVHGEIPKGMVVMHNCDNPACINIEHLSLGTQSQNRKDCINKGRANTPSGTEHYNSKLTVDTVKEIRSSNLNNCQIGKLYGVSRQTISDVRRGLTWKEVP